ncbi:XtrA/YqaO family protein [Bacillus pumilus]|uniref:XtrA/YqaO family protein n=1 Tax=Bacillus pumilus TaxID=1408 RepID=UPI00345691D0
MKEWIYLRLINLGHIIKKDKLLIDTKQQDCFAVILSNGAARMVELPTYRETKIITYDNTVTRVSFKEGELFK